MLKKLKKITIFLLFIFPFYLIADGGFVPSHSWDSDKLLSEPEQKAIILYDNFLEDLILNVQYKGQTNSFAWIIPFPNKPDVKKVLFSLFTDDYLKKDEKLSHTPLDDVTRDLVLGAKARKAILEGPGGVASSILKERKQLGVYDISILKPDNGASLFDWLKKNGFALPDFERISNVFKYYTEKNFYWVAVKIRDKAQNERTRKMLNSGRLPALHFSFKTTTDAPFYPLYISSVNKGETSLEIYIYAQKLYFHSLFTPEQFPFNTVRVHMDNLFIHDNEAIMIEPIAYFTCTQPNPSLYYYLPRLSNKAWYCSFFQKKIKTDKFKEDLYFSSELEPMKKSIGKIINYEKLRGVKFADVEKPVKLPGPMQNRRHPIIEQHVLLIDDFCFFNNFLPSDDYRKVLTPGIIEILYRKKLDKAFCLFCCKNEQERKRFLYLSLESGFIPDKTLYPFFRPDIKNVFSSGLSPAVVSKFLKLYEIRYKKYKNYLLEQAYIELFRLKRKPEFEIVSFSEKEKMQFYYLVMLVAFSDPLSVDLLGKYIFSDNFKIRKTAVAIIANSLNKSSLNASLSLYQSEYVKKTFLEYLHKFKDNKRIIVPALERLNDKNFPALLVDLYLEEKRFNNNSNIPETASQEYNINDTDKLQFNWILTPWHYRITGLNETFRQVIKNFLLAAITEKNRSLINYQYLLTLSITFNVYDTVPEVCKFTLSKQGLAALENNLRRNKEKYPAIYSLPEPVLDAFLAKYPDFPETAYKKSSPRYPLLVPAVNAMISTQNKKYFPMLMRLYKSISENTEENKDLYSLLICRMCAEYSDIPEVKKILDSIPDIEDILIQNEIYRQKYSPFRGRRFKYPYSRVVSLVDRFKSVDDHRRSACFFIIHRSVISKKFDLERRTSILKEVLDNLADAPDNLDSFFIYRDIFELALNHPENKELLKIIFSTYFIKKYSKYHERRFLEKGKHSDPIKYLFARIDSMDNINEKKIWLERLLPSIVYAGSQKLYSENLSILRKILSYAQDKNLQNYRIFEPFYYRICGSTFINYPEFREFILKYENIKSIPSKCLRIENFSFESIDWLVKYTASLPLEKQKKCWNFFGDKLLVYTETMTNPNLTPILCKLLRMSQIMNEKEKLILQMAALRFPYILDNDIRVLLFNNKNLTIAADIKNKRGMSLKNAKKLFGHLTHKSAGKQELWWHAIGHTLFKNIIDSGNVKDNTEFLLFMLEIASPYYAVKPNVARVIGVDVLNASLNSEYVRNSEVRSRVYNWKNKKRFPELFKWKADK